MAKVVASAKKMSKAERLAAMREKLKRTDTGGGGKGWWSPKQGRNVIRILPEVGEMDFFFQEVGRHTFPDGRKVYCPQFTTNGKMECPICELVNDLYADGAPSSVKLAKSIKLKRMYWMNVINRDNEDAGPLIFTPGVKIFGDLQGLIGDPDYGDITDVEDGLDIVIERDGKGLETSYQTKPRRVSSPLSDDDKLMEEWLEVAKDLSWVEVSDDPEEDDTLSKGHAVYVLPYDRIAKEFGVDDLDVDEMVSKLDSNQGDDEEEPQPSRQKKEKVAVKASKVPVKDIDEDEDEDDEDEEDEAEKEVERRSARRSRRR